MSLILKIYMYLHFLIIGMVQVAEIFPHGWQKTCLSSTVNTMSADDLAPCVARSSAGMVFT